MDVAASVSQFAALDALDGMIDCTHASAHTQPRVQSRTQNPTFMQVVCANVLLGRSCVTIEMNGMPLTNSLTTHA